MPKLGQTVTARPVPYDRPADGLYADAGLLSPAPSAHGLTWAWRLVSPTGAHITESGVLTPAELRMGTVENNLAETLAILFGLEALPNDWSGVVYSDNLNALRRAGGLRYAWRKGNMVGPVKFGGVPVEHRERMRKQWDRLGLYSCVLLGGHPNRKELAAGVRKDGKPVSIHNVELDRKCQELSSEWWDTELVKKGG